MMLNLSGIFLHWKADTFVSSCQVSFKANTKAVEQSSTVDRNLGNENKAKPLSPSGNWELCWLSPWIHQTPPCVFSSVEDEGNSRSHSCALYVCNAAKWSAEMN